jgi:hypothetical protein
MRMQEWPDFSGPRAPRHFTIPSSILTLCFFCNVALTSIQLVAYESWWLPILAITEG